MVDNSTHKNNTRAKRSQNKETQIASLIIGLTRTSAGSYEDGLLLPWVGVDFLQQRIRQKQSCIVTGDEWAGKGCAATLCQNSSNNSLIVIPSPVDTDEIFARLWYHLDKPTPTITYNPTTHEYTIPSSTCANCRLECRLKTTPSWDEPDTIKWLLSDITSKCLMKRYLVHHNLSKLRDKVVMLRIPDLNNDLLILLSELLERTTLIILATPKQKEKLCKENRFRRLHHLVFPKATDDFLLRILDAKVKDAGMDNSPFTPDATTLILALSQRSPGIFNQILDRILNQAELDGRTELIDSGYALEAIGETLDDRAMVLLALIETEYKIDRPGELVSVIERKFGVSIQARGIGEVLRNLGFQEKGKGRDGKGRRYRITQPTVPLLGIGITDTKEDLPEGDNNEVNVDEGSPEITSERCMSESSEKDIDF